MKTKIFFLIIICFIPKNLSALNFNEDIQNEFQKALILIENKSYLKSLEILNDIISREPSLTRVNLEIARAYFLNNDYKKSKKIFKNLLKEDIPINVKENINFYLNQINNYEGFASFYSLNIFPNFQNNFKQKKSIVNLNLNGNSIPFKIDKKEQKGIGLNIKGDLELRKFLFSKYEKNIIFSPVIGGSINQYENKIYNDSLFHLTPKITIKGNLSRIDTGLKIEKNWLSERHYYNQFGYIFNISKTLKNYDFYFSTSVMKKEHVNKFNLKDGEIYKISFETNKAFPKKYKLKPKLYFSTTNANVNYEDNHTLGFLLSLSSERVKDIRYSFEFDTSILKFKGIEPLFFEPRKDRYRKINFKLNNKKIILCNLIPQLFINYTRNFSNNAIHDYSMTEFGIEFKNTF